MKSLLDKVNAKLNAQGGFLKAVSVLVGGTAFAQGIALLSLPILTRLYNPDDFSLFAVYFSLLAILSVSSCLRFEIAVPIPKKDSEAIQLVILAIISNFCISLLIGFIIWIFHSEIIEILKQPNFSTFIWLIPIGVFFSGMYNALQYWTTRKKNFYLIVKTRMTQSLSGVLIQIVMGLFGYNALGLIIGQIVKVSAGIRSLSVNFWLDASNVIKSIRLNTLKIVFKKNDHFPKYSTFEAFANSAGIQIPIIIIAALSIGPEAGYLMLAVQIMAIPMRFLGGAISQVYLANAPEALDRGEIRLYTLNVLKELVKYGISILVLIGILSPVVIKYILGSNWAYVGILISWMIPWFIFQLLSSPISMIMHIVKKQKEMMILTIFGFVFKVSFLYIQYYFDKRYLVESYAISNAIFYFICFFVFTKNAKFVSYDYFYLVRKAAPTLFIVVIVAIILMYILKRLGL
ncbi:lipopolysaccharide biosynthesis protein [Acinetobacter indicus]|uniref:lipopolysaccharide biosynthesis protein n=1 Tax=Acinetobacter indicus TaxID=756892 RepID=UPI000CECE0B7|nr:oligosaccharide flippase family protein [Acinetobacter indicus]